MVGRKEFPMTEKGRDKLEQELLSLQVEKRKEVEKRIKNARSFCDFMEDSEYSEAIKEQLAVEEKIKNIKIMLQQAKIISKNNQSDQVTLGSTVTFKEVPNGEEETFTIVGLAEANVLDGKISDRSPIAKSLLGHKVNDIVSIQTPSGKIKVKITNIEK